MTMNTYRKQQCRRAGARMRGTVKYGPLQPHLNPLY